MNGDGKQNLSPTNTSSSKHIKLESLNESFCAAVDRGNIETVKLIVEDPAFDPSFHNEHIWGKLLLTGRIGAKINYSSPWTYYFLNRHYKIIELLFKDPRMDPSANDNFALKVASNSREEYVELVEILLKDSRVDPSADDNCAIKLACENGNSKLVELLLKDPRVDPSADDNDAIKGLTSIRDNRQIERYKIVEMLLTDSRVDPSAGDNYAIQMASKNASFKIVNLLLKDARVDPSAGNNCALRNAFKNYNFTEIVDLLLKDSRVDPSTGDHYAIKQAALKGSLDVVKTLLKYANVDPTADNNFALRFAQAYGHSDVAEVLRNDSRVLEFTPDSDSEYQCTYLYGVSLDIKKSYVSNSEQPDNYEKMLEAVKNGISGIPVMKNVLGFFPKFFKTCPYYSLLSAEAVISSTYDEGECDFGGFKFAIDVKFDSVIIPCYIEILNDTGSDEVGWFSCFDLKKCKLIFSGYYSIESYIDIQNFEPEYKDVFDTRPGIDIQIINCCFFMANNWDSYWPALKKLQEDYAASLSSIFKNIPFELLFLISKYAIDAPPFFDDQLSCIDTFSDLAFNGGEDSLRIVNEHVESKVYKNMREIENGWLYGGIQSLSLGFS